MNMKFLTSRCNRNEAGSVLRNRSEIAMECVGPSSYSTSTLISDSEEEYCTNDLWPNDIRSQPAKLSVRCPFKLTRNTIFKVPRKFRYCCWKGFARLRSLVRVDGQEEDDDWGGEHNFILISAKYLVTSYHWTRHYISHYLTSKDDYWRSVVLSVSLFLVGVKLMREFVPAKVEVPVEPK